MRRFYLQGAQSLADRVRLTPEKDYLIFRRGEAFAARLVAGRGAEAEAVVLRVSEAEGDNVVQELRHEIPAGGGNMEATLVFPTATEGTFDVEVLDTQGNHVDRTIQYCVVDTRKPSFPTTLKTELVEVVDATTRAPDYTRGETRVVNSPGRLPGVSRPGAGGRHLAGRVVCLHAEPSEGAGGLPAAYRVPG